jgi:hypothetical protein
VATFGKWVGILRGPLAFLGGPTKFRALPSGPNHPLAQTAARRGGFGDLRSARPSGGHDGRAMYTKAALHRAGRARRRHSSVPVRVPRVRELRLMRRVGLVAGRTIAAALPPPGHRGGPLRGHRGRWRWSSPRGRDLRSIPPSHDDPPPPPRRCSQTGPAGRPARRARGCPRGFYNLVREALGYDRRSTIF